MIPFRRIGAGNFEAFVAPARIRPQIWRLILGIGMVCGLFILSTVTVLVTWQLLVVYLDLGYAFLWTGSTYRLHPLNIVIYLSSFAFSWAALLLVVRMLHKRGFATLFGIGGFQMRAYRLGILFMVGVSALEFAYFWTFDRPVLNVELTAWLSWIAPLLVVLILQTTAEELFFRGYLQQQLAARFRSPLIWWVLPAFLFGLAHFNQGELNENAWIVVAITFLMGLILGDITARTGNISLAMGLHMGNNIFALLLLGLPGGMSSMTLFVVNVELSDVTTIREGLLGGLIVLLVLYTGYLVLLWRGVIAFPTAPSYLEAHAGNEDRRS